MNESYHRGPCAAIDFRCHRSIALCYNFHMKKFLPILLLLTLFSPAQAETMPDNTADFVTGEDWVRHMSRQEKMMALIHPAFVLADYDVRLRISLPQYVFLMDRVVENNPVLEREEVSNIFASTIYLFEPENRLKLKNLEMNFLRGDLEAKAVTTPRLTVVEDDYLELDNAGVTNG